MPPDVPWGELNVVPEKQQRAFWADLMAHWQPPAQPVRDDERNPPQAPHEHRHNRGADRMPANRIIGERIVKRTPRAPNAGVPAMMIAFPIARQRNVIAKIAAAVMRARSSASADRHLGRALRSIMNEMRCQGISAAMIRSEVYAMEVLIRAACWRMMFPWADMENVRGSRRCRKFHSHRGLDTSADQLVFPWMGGSQ